MMALLAGALGSLLWVVWLAIRAKPQPKPPPRRDE
jgi:hypothetical protein